MDKKVSVKSCIFIAAIAGVAFLIAILCPYVIGSKAADGSWNLSGGVQLAIGKFSGFTGTAFSHPQYMFDALTNAGALPELSGLIDSSFIGVFTFFSYWLPYVFLFILLADVAMALLLLFVFKRENKFRKICKVISIVFAIAMIVIFLYFLVYTIFCLFHEITVWQGSEYITGSTIAQSIFSSGFFWSLFCTGVSGFLISKQFKWFSAVY